MNLSSSPTVPEILQKAGLTTESHRVAQCRPGSACNRRFCPRCQTRGKVIRQREILESYRRVPHALPLFGTFTIADVPTPETRSSLRGVLRAAGKMFRAFPHHGAHYAGQITPGNHPGTVHPHIHALLLADVNHQPVDWLAEWQAAVEDTHSGLITQCADVQEPRGVGAVCAYIFRGPVDALDWADRTEDLSEVFAQLKGLGLNGIQKSSSY